MEYYECSLKKLIKKLKKLKKVEKKKEKYVDSIREE